MNKKLKRELTEWVIFFGIIGTLYLTGLHTTVFGTLQRGILATGLFRPDVEMEETSQASYNLLLMDADGNEVDLHDWQSETIFINMWATWCPPCIAEMPDINRLYAEVGGEVKFAMISLDDDPQKAIDFVMKKEFDFPVYFLRSALPRVYASQSIPTTFVISPEGKIVVKNKGMAQYYNDAFVTFLRGL